MGTTATRLIRRHVRESESYFRTEHLHADLKGRSVRGGAATMVAQAASFVLKLGSTAILARLLTPADFGLIAMVTAVTGFVEMFKDAGLSMATVQRAEINHRQVSTLFWINLGLSVLLMCAIGAMAPAIAWFYGEPNLLAVTLVLAALLPLSGLTIQHQALLKRQMRFGLLATISVAAEAVGVIAAITTAVAGAAYWALVAMMGARVAANALLVWLFCPWYPGLPSRATGVRPMLAFGVNLTGFSFLNYWIRNTDNLLLGWGWGPMSLGLYSRAYTLLLTPLSQVFSPISAVAIPALSRLQQDSDGFRRCYCAAIRTLSYVVAPLVFLSIALADGVVLLVLGTQWRQVTPIFLILAIGGVFQPVVSTVGWLFITTGRPHKHLRWAVFAAPFFLLSFVVGVQWGAWGMAVAFSLTATLNAFGAILYACHGIDLTPRDIVTAVRLPYAFGLSLAIPAALLRTGMTPSISDQPLLMLACGGVGAACVAFLWVLLSKTLRSDLALLRRKALWNGPVVTGRSVPEADRRDCGERETERCALARAAMLPH